MKFVTLGIIAAVFSTQAFAQDEVKVKQEDSKKKKHMSVSIGTDAIKIEKTDGDSICVKKEEKAFEVEFGMVDLGFNSLKDNTNYAASETQSFLNVPGDMKNENLFSLRQGKSVNVNVYPVMLKWRAAKTRTQKIYFSTGVGLQMYNFRFNKNISYINQTVPMVIQDSVSFSKNKLGFTYLSVPLSVTFKSRLAEKAWLVYGAGITGGYRIASWTKQVSGQRGKDKNHDKFNFADFNSCVTGEIGLDGYFRLYASYQLTALHENALDQHPFCIGIRFGGI